MRHGFSRVAIALVLATPLSALAAVINVPGDRPSVQAALNAAGPGDTVLLAPGTYHEKVSFPASGLPGSPVTLTSSGGAVVTTLSGASIPGANVVLIDSRSHVRVSGLTIRDNTGVTDGSGIRIIGSLSDVEIRGNVIHEIRGNNAMGITVYATEAAPIQDLVIDGNEIYDCDPAPSEALTLNGNVRAFEVTGNHIHDVDNIAIDFIGGETDIQPNSALVAREGVCRGNIVERCGSGYSGGIYVDGGRDIVIENNTVTECDLGIEVGAENAGIVARNVVVRNNLLYNNRVVGIVFGGYSKSVGRADNNVFRGNTLYKNATHPIDGVGEVWVQYGNDNLIEDNKMDNVLFGFSLEQSQRNTVRNNKVVGKNVSLGRRGDGIKLWYSHYNLIEGNTFTKGRDIVFWYSTHNRYVGNRQSGGRYGLHLMQAQYNIAESNYFFDNSTGISMMYDTGDELRNNVIAKAVGAQGVCISLKESSDVVIENNDILYCSQGISIDVAPYEPDSKNFIRGNRIAYNDIGVAFLNDWKDNEFTGNLFSGNITEVAVYGGGSAKRNVWDSNRWEDYQGFDRDGDGVGDKPHRLFNYAGRVWMDKPNTRFFKGTPLLEVLDFLDRLAPFSEPVLMLEDKHPLVASDDKVRAGAHLAPPEELLERPDAKPRPEFAPAHQSGTESRGALREPQRRPLGSKDDD